MWRTQTWDRRKILLFYTDSARRSRRSDREQMRQLWDRVVFGEALRILAKPHAGGWTSWNGPEPFQKGIGDYWMWEEIIEEERMEDSLGAGSLKEKTSQPTDSSTITWEEQVKEVHGRHEHHWLFFYTGTSENLSSLQAFLESQGATHYPLAAITRI